VIHLVALINLLSFVLSQLNDFE